MKNERKPDMLNQTLPQLPSAKEETHICQAHVEKSLWSAVAGEMSRRNLTIRQVVNWGLRAFLLASNQREAQRLGIKSEKL